MNALVLIIYLLLIYFCVVDWSIMITFKLIGFPELLKPYLLGPFNALFLSFSPIVIYFLYRRLNKPSKEKEMLSAIRKVRRSSIASKRELRKIEAVGDYALTIHDTAKMLEAFGLFARQAMPSITEFSKRLADVNKDN